MHLTLQSWAEPADRDLREVWSQRSRAAPPPRGVRVAKSHAQVLPAKFIHRFCTWRVSRVRTYEEGGRLHGNVLWVSVHNTLNTVYEVLWQHLVFRIEGWQAAEEFCSARFGPVRTS